MTILIMKFFLFFLFLFISFNSYSFNRVFTPINNAKIVHGQGATIRNLVTAGNTLAGRTRIAAAVTTGGNFAVATINPKNSLALAKQLARGNPYALAAMAALAYYQDDLGDWYHGEDTLDENEDFHLPELEQLWSAECESSTEKLPIGNFGALPSTLNIKNACGATLATMIADKKNETVSGGFTYEARYESPFIKVDKTHPDLNKPSERLSFSVYVSDQLETEMYVCPPTPYPTYTLPGGANADGDIEQCFDPATAKQYLPAPVTFEEIAPPYADDLMRHHNESIDELQNWAPYIGDSGNVEPQYVESYNQPDVSSQMNEYMKSVSSGQYQTSDASAANYVPAEMLQPTQVAIESTFNDAPFVDPTTGAVTEPDVSTDGAATPTPDSSVGSIENPMHVTGDITVNVQIPEDDTLSQTEYEQSNRKFQQEESDLAQIKTDELTTSLEDIKTSDKDFMDGLDGYIQDFGVPEIPTLASFFPSFNSGCVGFTLDLSVRGVVKSTTFDKHCQPWNAYVNPVLTWFLYMMTSLYVLNLAGRTLTGLKT